MPPHFAPVSTPCNECGVMLTREPGTCGRCGGIPWTHGTPAADRDTEDRIWQCRAARCDSGGHVIQRVRTHA